MSEYSEETIKAIPAAYEAGLAQDTLKWVTDESKLYSEYGKAAPLPYGYRFPCKLERVTSKRSK